MTRHNSDYKSHVTGDYIVQGRVVDHDEDETALLDRIDAKYPVQVVMVRQVLIQPQGDLYHRSPRFVRNQS